MVGVGGAGNLNQTVENALGQGAPTQPVSNTSLVPVSHNWVCPGAGSRGWQVTAWGCSLVTPRDSHILPEAAPTPHSGRAGVFLVERLLAGGRPGLASPGVLHSRLVLLEGRRNAPGTELLSLWVRSRETWPCFTGLARSRGPGADVERGPTAEHARAPVSPARSLRTAAARAGRPLAPPHSPRGLHQAPTHPTPRNPGLDP